MRDDSGLRREEHARFRSRLERDGWVKIGGQYSRKLPDEWVLRRVTWSGGYVLAHPASGVIAMPCWDWAEWDRHRLVFAEGGCLREARLGAETVHVGRTLCDFSGVEILPDPEAVI